MRRILGSISLIFILLAPAVLTYGWLQCRKAMVRQEVKWKIIGGLEPDELVLLKLSNDQARTSLYWEHDQEFEYHGRMYDVVSKEKTADSIFLWCWPDQQETLLNKQLAILADGAISNDLPHKSHQSRLLNFLQLPFCSIELKGMVFPEPVEVCSPTTFCLLPETRNLIPNSPPPRLC